MTEFSNQIDDAPSDSACSPPAWPVAPLERYLLADDRHDPNGRGMSFPVTFSFLGRMNDPLWRLAVANAIERHPLLGCRLKLGRRPAWLNMGTPAEACQAAADAAARSPSGRIYPTQSPPFSWSIHERDDGCDVVFQFHHAAVDGVGALQFIGDCFQQYHQQLGNDGSTRLPPLDSRLLANRASLRFDETPRSVHSEVSVQPLSIPAEMKRFFLRRISPLAKDLAKSQGQPTGDESKSRKSSALTTVGHQSDLFQVEIDQADTDRVRNFAVTAGVTVNDWAMRCLLLAMREHNLHHGKLGRWYRLTMPANLRGRKEKRLPACNRIGFAFIDRDLAQLPNLDELLASLAWENELVRNQKLAGEFLGVLAGIARVPGLMRLLTSARLQATSAVFSNIGDPLRRFHWRPPIVDGLSQIGNLRLIGFAGAPPVRPGTPASFLLHQLCGRIHLNLLVDRRVLGPQAAHRLLFAWRNRLLCDGLLD
jgi:hypothetical protein